MVDKFTNDGLEWELTPGREAHLHLGKTGVIDGYIDILNVADNPNSRNITIQGRSKTADLVDCSALGPFEFDGGLTLTQIAEKLCQPFGISVIALADVGEPFPVISIKPSDKVFDILNKLAKQRGLLLYSSTEGNLVINKRGLQRAATELVQGVNVLSARASYDNTNRFSEYVVKGQNDGSIDGLIGDKPEDATEAEGSAKDSGINRYRPTVIIAENAGSSQTSKERAEWEATYRAAKGTTISVTVKDWKEKNGQLWDINKLVYLRYPRLGVNGQFLINAVSYKQDENSSRTCTLELVRKDAYERTPEIKKEDDPVDLLGF